MLKPRNILRPTSRTRHALRGLVGLVAVAAAVSACSDAPSSPAAGPSELRLSKSGGGSGRTERVGRAAPLSEPVSVSYRIDPKRSDTLEIPGVGFALEIPKGAVTEPVTITATALPGAIVAYRFEPHGLVFRRPLHATQDLAAIAPQVRAALGNLLAGILRGEPVGSALEVSYFADESVLAGEGPVDVLEFLGSTLDLRHDRVEFDIAHFSGYMVSWGRSRAY